ncbi:MAG: hypothetical protein ACK5G7_03335 [Erysipelotrichaceae bacterium]
MTLRDLIKEGWLEVKEGSDLDKNIELNELKNLVNFAFNWQKSSGVNINPTLAKRYELNN